MEDKLGRFVDNSTVNPYAACQDRPHRNLATGCQAMAHQQAIQSFFFAARLFVHEGLKEDGQESSRLREIRTQDRQEVSFASSSGEYA